MTPPEKAYVVKEEYSPGYGRDIVKSHATRSAQVEAGFFTAHLRSGMHLLDCGCGPGTIAAGLARHLFEGSVVGIDISANQVETAQRRALANGLDNAHFQVGSVYKLPFPDESFDAVFAHGLLQHLIDPIAAIAEMHRVLRPGGCIGVRDDDVGSLILAPASPEMDRVLQVLQGVMRLSGGDPTIGRRYRTLLRCGGFHDIYMSATTEYDGTNQATTVRGDLAASLLEHMVEKAIAADLVTAEEMQALIEASRAWGRHQDAFDAIIWCEAVGWKRPVSAP